MEPAHLRAVQQGREDPSDRHLSGLLLGSGRSPQGALEALIKGPSQRACTGGHWAASPPPRASTGLPRSPSAARAGRFALPKARWRPMTWRRTSTDLGSSRGPPLRIPPASPPSDKTAHHPAPNANAFFSSSVCAFVTVSLLLPRHTVSARPKLDEEPPAVPRCCPLPCVTQCRGTCFRDSSSPTSSTPTPFSPSHTSRESSARPAGRYSYPLRRLLVIAF